ncbi:kinase inhibitor [Pantoea sp. Mhis]|uniref:kinase inhibitor n=1 Tax=Pantoea sp. Mhis TaxID=2576759 RepID=UPI00135CC40B|nr:kinase inhibitor [Pantoea sp. Mhis]MXP56299.1 kinase inhibitor [Pantoea sp. Mhis]
MRIFSKDFYDGDKMPELHVFNGMGYTGGNISPHLSWDEIPSNTKSFIITCYDPDAPTGSGWWHWIVVNIPITVNMLEQGAGTDINKLPKGAIQTRTDFGKIGYGGAAPPPNKSHRYIFNVHALNINKLNVDENDSGAMVGFKMHYHLITSASITAIYL